MNEVMGVKVWRLLIDGHSDMRLAASFELLAQMGDLAGDDPLAPGVRHVCGGSVGDEHGQRHMLLAGQVREAIDLLDLVPCQAGRSLGTPFCRPLSLPSSRLWGVLPPWLKVCVFNAICRGLGMVAEGNGIIALFFKGLAGLDVRWECEHISEGDFALKGRWISAAPGGGSWRGSIVWG